MQAFTKSLDRAAAGVPQPGAVRGRRSQRALVIKVLKLVVAVVLLAVLVLRIGWQDLASSFASLAWWWIPGLLAVRLGGLFLQSLRWKLFLDAHDIQTSPLRLFKQYWVSRFFNNFLPGQAGGDASRVFYGWDKTVKKTKLASSVIMDRMVGLLGLLLVAAVVGFARYDFVSSLDLRLWPWCAAAGAMALLLLITSRAPTLWAQRAIRFLPGTALRSKVAGVLRDLAVHNDHWGRLLGGVVLSAGFYVVAAVHAYLAFRAFGVQVEFVGILVIVPLVALVMAVPISVNGWGVAEVVKVVLYSQLGASPAAALSVALLGRLTLSLIGGMGGLIYLLSPGPPRAKRQGRRWLFFQTGT